MMRCILSLGKSFMLTFVLILMLVGCMPEKEGVTTHADVHRVGSLLQIATNQLPEILENMPVGRESDYGFHNRAEFVHAVVGLPYQEYAIKTQLPTGYWRIPVVVNGEHRAMLRYGLMDGGWSWEGIGAHGLARELGEVEESLSQLPRSGKIIRDHQFVCDYVQYDVPPDGKVYGSVIPLKTAKRYLQTYSMPVHSVDLSEILMLRASDRAKLHQ